MTAMLKERSYPGGAANVSDRPKPLLGGLPEAALAAQVEPDGGCGNGGVVVLGCATAEGPMTEKRKLAAILAADVVGFSRLTGADEDRTLARLRALRSDLIDPTIAVHNGRVFKRTGDGAVVEFRSVVDAVRCAIEVQNSMVDRNAGVAQDRRIEFRIGIHVGDVVEESDGDLMGDGVNIAARLESIAKPGAVSCPNKPIGRSRRGSTSRTAISARPNFGESDREQLLTEHTDNLEAHDLFLRGRELWWSLTKEKQPRGSGTLATRHRIRP